MKNSSLSSKLLLGALFPIVCFAIAIYGVKWYCDTVTPSEYQRFAKLGTHGVTSEFVKKEELPECLSRHNVSFIANVTHIFPELQAKAKEEADDDFYVSNFRKGNVYAFEEYNGQNKSWWLYYYNGGWQLHELKNNAPDFANSVINVILILTFGICLISFAVTVNIPKPKMSNYKYSSLLCICWLLSAEWFVRLLFGSNPLDVFRSSDYPMFIALMLMFNEICVILTVLYAHYVNRELDSKEKGIIPDTINLNLNQKVVQDPKDQSSDKENKLWGKGICGKFIQVENFSHPNNDRVEIIINGDRLLLYENNCWERYSYEEIQDNSIFATNVAGKTILIDSTVSRVGCYSGYQLSYNDMSFTESGKPLSEWETEMKQKMKLELRDIIIAELTRKNFVQKIFGFISKNDDTQQRVDRINQLFEEAYEIKGITSYLDIESFIKEQLKQDKKQK